MRWIELRAVGAMDGRLLAGLAPVLAAELGAECRMAARPLDPGFAYDPSRRQYHSTEILRRLGAEAPADAWRVLGVTPGDLYIPVLTFVFGEAQLGAPCAVVSTNRLRPEFYGLAPDPPLVSERLAKEAVHELGHTLGFVHCDTYWCAMAASHCVEAIDLKGTAFCSRCRASPTR
jgi:archaemetzincin